MKEKKKGERKRKRKKREDAEEVVVVEVVVLSWFLAAAWLECSLSSHSSNSVRGGHTSFLVVTLATKARICYADFFLPFHLSK